MSHIQNDLMTSNVKKVELEAELNNARAEIRDYKQRIYENNNKVQELQRQLQDLVTDKNRSGDKLHEMEKVYFLNKIINN